MTTTETPLSVDARRRALCELADLYAAEQSAADRPLTKALPAIIPPLCSETLGCLDVLDFFDQFARSRAVSGHADATHDEMHRAEARAERLLDHLTGPSS